MSLRFEFIEHLPGGGFGKIAVYYDKLLRRKVVQKSLRKPTPENCEALIREGRLYMKFSDHNHIVDLIGYRFNYTNPCLVLPYYEEGTLQKRIGNRNWYESIIFVQHASKAVQALHANGGFARDIKPSNLFVDVNKQGQKLVKMGDLGLGRLPYPFTSGDITRHACGTPEYMAPELFEPNPQFTPACDIYALGITGIELITGSRKRNSIHDIWINSDVTNLLLSMTADNPNQRPNAIRVDQTIRNIIQAYDKNFNTFTKIAAGALGIFLLSKLGK